MTVITPPGASACGADRPWRGHPLPLAQFQAIDLPLGLPVAPPQRQSSVHGILIGAQFARKPREIVNAASLCGLEPGRTSLTFPATPHHQEVVDEIRCAGDGGIRDPKRLPVRALVVGPLLRSPQHE